jgi:hypothetical protein
MEKDYGHLLNLKTPLMFCDGTKLYEELAKKYVTHKVGYFIMAPSGAGKTHFVDRQTEPHWMDGDELWCKSRAQPAGAWWLEPIETTDEIDQRSDIVTIEAKKLGFWIIGASNYFLKPDAIVIPEWETHKEWIRAREQNNYDGGATSKDFEQVARHRDWILRWQQQGVPKFETVTTAAEFLAAKH